MECGGNSIYIVVRYSPFVNIFYYYSLSFGNTDAEILDAV